MSYSKQEIERDENKARELQTEIRSVETKVEKARERGKRTLRMPMLHRIEKRTVFLAVHDGKFYAVSDVGRPRQGGRRGYDRSDVSVKKTRTGGTLIEVRPGGGQPMTENAEKTGKIAQALENIDPEREFVNFAVSTDSFGEFNHVKTIFIRAGFDYNWVVIRDGIFSIVGAGAVHAQ